MSGKPAEQDNSIEEILASIRQIISEDDKPADPAAASAPVADDAPVLGVDPLALPTEPMNDGFDAVSDASMASASADDVFELVDRVIAEEEPIQAAPPAPLPVTSYDELPPLPPVPPSVPERPVAMTPPPPAPVAPQPPVAVPETPIFTDVAATATLGAFSKLSETILLERQRQVATATITLEDIVKELLQPLLRQWIDQHVPGIVDRLVREELEKLSRQAREG